MDRNRIEKYISVWLKTIKQEDLKELENDIEMPLIPFVTDTLVNLHEKYSDVISSVPVELDSYSDYIIVPKNGKYSLEDFLLNRLFRSVQALIYRDESELGNFASSHYAHDECEVLIDKERIQKKTLDVRVRRKIVAHEFLHGIKTQFCDDNFFDTDKYFQMKEEFKSIFGSEINDFDEKSVRYDTKYKHCGMNYASRYKSKNSKKYAFGPMRLLDEILNEKDSLDVTKSDFRSVGYLDESHYVILKNPESSNTFITNYAFILEKIVDKKVLFTGLYLEPEIFYNTFNSQYNPIFQIHFNSELSAMEILISNLRHLVEHYEDIDVHTELANTLYDCVEKKYIMDNFDDKARRTNIVCVGVNGPLKEFYVADTQVPLAPDTLKYAAEYNGIVQKKLSSKNRT